MPAKAKKHHVPYRYLAENNIPRPQLMFKDKVDNSSCPFVPKLKVKYNAQESLSGTWLMCGFDKSLPYPHPYQYELDHFQPSYHQLRAVVPTKPGRVNATPLTLIYTKEPLEDLCRQLKRETEISVDLEHHSLRSFLGLTCLMQISTRTQDFVIDTLALRSELHILNDVFTDPAIVKVFHGANSDIEWLQRDLGLYIVNMFDTGQASHILGLTGHSLSHLLAHYLGIEMDKQFQLADWRIRPLPLDMLMYARGDTHYLLYIYDLMKNELLQQSGGHINMLQSVLTKSNKICAKVYQKPVFHDKSHLEVLKQQKKQFSPQQLEALRGIYAWRDEVARMEDESPGYVLTNQKMLRIAESLPRDRQGILDCCKPTSSLVQQDLGKLMTIVEAATGTSLADARRPDACQEINRPLLILFVLLGILIITGSRDDNSRGLIILAAIICYVYYMLKPGPHRISHGFAAPGWESVAKVFRCEIETGHLKGGALSVYHKGKLVVEMYGGQADPVTSLMWGRDTLTQAESTTKGVAAIVMAMLVDRGLMSYHDPVSKHWPEFAAEDKGSITVEQLLSHRAGLPVIDEQFSLYDVLTDPGKVGEILARQRPVWTPGTKHGYHGVTFGLYVDQLVRHIDPLKRDLRTFFNDEIAKPFGIDFFIGLPKEENCRCARAFDFSFFSFDIFHAWRYCCVMFAFATDENSLIRRQVKNPRETTMDLENDPTFREIPCGSSHGFGTVTSLAKLFGILANGGVYNGKQLLSKDAIDRMMEPLAVGWDRVLQMYITYGRGVTLRDVYPFGYMFGAPGTGGQMGYADPQHKLSIAFLTNYRSIFSLGDDPRYLVLERAIYRCIPGAYKEDPAPSQFSWT